MKSTEQNTKEVMTYLKKSAQHFFESEDGKNWQAITQNSAGEYVFVIDGEVHPIKLDVVTGEGVTDGKACLKRKHHPTWDVPRIASSAYWKSWGHGPSRKLRAVRKNKFRRELIEIAVREAVENC